MKFPYIILLATVLFAACVFTAAQTPQSSKPAPKYDTATEVTLNGVIAETTDRICPVSGGLGFHFMLKQADGKLIEVHVSTTKFVKDYELSLKRGDDVKVVGSKVQMDGVDTILAREVVRGNETLAFRDKDGKPAW